MQCPITFHARKSPSHIALRSDAESLTYLELAEEIEGAASWLTSQGISKGDHIAIIAHKRIETIIVMWALFHVGAILCPLCPDLPPTAIEEQLGRADATLLSNFPRMKKTFKDHQYNSNSLSTFLFTSGSTGEPKLAMHTLDNHFQSAIGLLMQIPFANQDTWLLKLPLYHVSGIAPLFRTFLVGATLLLTDKQNYTHTSIVPSQLDSISRKPKFILLGGTTLSPQDTDLPIYYSYGMTEMSSTITLNKPGSTFSMGNLLPFRKLRVIDGELHVGGKTLFSGYYKEKPAPEWFPTGDLGSYDQIEGLQFHGRKDRLMISGGENIQPEEIESLLLSLQGIAKARVVSIKDATFGERPIAYIEKKSPLPRTQIISHLEKHLPKWKIPDAFLDWNEIR